VTTTLVKRAPQARCYECGTTELKAACHHCGRAMCTTHTRGVVGTVDLPVTHEFAGMDLDKMAPLHCSGCDHIVKGHLWKPFGVAAAVAVIGLALVMVDVTTGLVLFLVGGSVAAAMFAVTRRRTDEARRTRPPLPVVPNIDLVRLEETLRGRLTLDTAGRYTTSVDPVRGRLVLDLTLGRPDRDRLDAYRRRFRLGAQDSVDLAAGFAMLRGPAGLEFIGGGARDTLIPLRSTTAEHPFFGAADSRAGAQWCVDMNHRLEVSPPVDAIPVWLTPTLAPGSDRRTLELEIQWQNFGSGDTRLTIDRVEALRLNVPVEWGTVERAGNLTSVGRATDADGQHTRRLEWIQPPIDDNTLTRRRFALSVRFEEPIRPTDVIRGELEVVFRGALSGVRRVDFFHPLGVIRPQNKAQEIRTTVLAEFELSLQGVRYQEVRSVPDPKKPNDSERQEDHEFDVIPDHETIIELTNALSEQGYYVKRVIENPPSSASRAGVVNRYWDVAGRRYRKVYPIDFHVTLTGEEVHRGDIRAHAGRTKVRLTTQGAYTSELMESQVEQEWDRLFDLVKETLEQRVGQTASPTSAHVPPTEPGPADHSRHEELRRRQDALLEALLAGRIQDETYREASARIERELGEI
jgi:hypothetical protein